MNVMIMTGREGDHACVSRSSSHGGSIAMVFCADADVDVDALRENVPYPAEGFSYDIDGGHPCGSCAWYRTLMRTTIASDRLVI